MSKEQTLSTERPWSGRLISVRVDTVRLATGKETTREVVEHPGAVGILAWDGERLAMVRQWRHPTGGELLEIPAGTLDPDDRDPLATAKRELAEECALAADDWQQGPTFFTAPGFCTEKLTIFLATGLRAVQVQTPEDEDLELEWLTLAEALSAIDSGRVQDAKTIAGILWLPRRLATRGQS
jgi:ADP-ribose pyrophosphatase